MKHAVLNRSKKVIWPLKKKKKVLQEIHFTRHVPSKKIQGSYRSYQCIKGKSSLILKDPIHSQTGAFAVSYAQKTPGRHQGSDQKPKLARGELWKQV